MEKIVMKDRYYSDVSKGDVVTITGDKNPNKGNSGVFVIEDIFRSENKPGLIYAHVNGIDKMIYADEIQLYAKKVE